jgi:hypothetical protein
MKRRDNSKKANRRQCLIIAADLNEVKVLNGYREPVLWQNYYTLTLSDIDDVANAITIVATGS